MRASVLKKEFSPFLLYVFAFFMLWEWLRPLGQLTDTGQLGIFIFFLVIAFLGAYFGMNRILLSCIKGVYILGAIYSFYFSGGFFHFKWWKSFAKIISENIGFIVDSNWNEITNEFRTLLFFILLWLIVYLIQYWLLNRQRIFIFFFMTIIYITVLDTFTPYDGKGAIMRTVIAGFTVMGMLTFYRLLKRDNIEKEPSFTRKWMIPLAGMIVVSTAAGFAAPKPAAVWPDPVPFIQSLNDKAGEKGSGGVSRIGYGTNDSRLGGPFISDSSIVFTAEAESRNYWKVESKDVYTGKGWITTLKSERLNFKSGESVPLEYTPKSVKTEKEHAQINMNILYKHIIYPYGLRIIGTGTLTKFELDQDLEKIYSFGPSKHPEVLRKYSVDFEVPTYRVSELTKVTGKDASQMSQEFITRYTQLPQRLPLRVIQLAEKITADKTNWFDKAKAIESFFDSPEYTYDQKKVAVPGKKDDYVDQFLFETKRGYCDNFSTSMVVMLRSIGIPARWVKGYSSGEFKKYSDTDTSRQIYEISNNNAHSWVEAYFPNQGWLPFEPTKGFSNNIKLNYEIKTTPAGQSEAVPAVAPKKPQPNRMEEMEKKTATSKTTGEKQSLLKRSMLFVQTNWGWILFSLLAVGAVILLLYQIRFRWLPHYFILLFKWRKKDVHLAKAYLVLLKQLERYGLKRKDDQTLRNYARYVDSFFSSNEMGRLTSRYEQYIYNSNLPAGSWKELKELWENLIKKTIA